MLTTFIAIINIRNISLSRKKFSLEDILDILKVLYMIVIKFFILSELTIRKLMTNIEWYKIMKIGKVADHW